LQKLVAYDLLVRLVFGDELLRPHIFFVDTISTKWLYI
jgi:hypothetical protein